MAGPSSRDLFSAARKLPCALVPNLLIGHEPGLRFDGSVRSDRSVRSNNPGRFIGSAVFGAKAPATRPKASNRVTVLSKLSICLLSFWLATADVARAATDARIIERYHQMLATNPVDENALDRLWKIAQADGFAEKLLDRYAKPAGKGDFPSQLILAELLHRAGRDDESRHAFDRAATLNPKSPLPHLALAGILPPSEAAAELERAVALEPKNAPMLADLIQKLADARIAAGQPDRAAEAWERLVALAPDTPEPRRRLAAFYLEKGMAAPAAAHLAWLETHGDTPTRVNALRSLARLHEASGAFDSALEVLNKAMALTSADNWLRAELVTETIRVSRRANRLSELETRWKKEADENPRIPSPWLQLAELYSQQGNPGAERAALEKAAVLIPDDFAVRIRLGRLLVRMDDLPGAAAQLDVALAARAASGQMSADLVFERAELDIRRGDPAAAQARIDALSAGPVNETLAARIVDFYRRNRMFDAIERRLRKPNADPAALADFLFTQNRREEARAALRKLVRAEDPPKVRAEEHERVAELLKQAGETVAALAELREAARMQPDARRIQLMLGDAILAAGEPKLAPGTAGQTAREAYEKAFVFSHTEEERTEADRRIFRSFEREAPAPPEESGSASEARRAVTELLSVPDGSGPMSNQNPALAAFIQTLETRAMKSKGADGAQAWLRLARWQFWNRDPETAKAAASQAMELAPESTAPRELAITLALAAGDRNGAIAQLRRLAQTAPDRKDGYLRQVARIQMQMNQHEEAIKLLKSLALGQAPDALTELAGAQQQADRWRDALATWQLLYATAKKERRHEFLPPLVHAMQHLQIYQPAAEILWSAFQEQTGEPAHGEVLHTLIAHCREHGLTNWLLEKLQVRAGLSGNPSDTAALATALRADGRLAEASKQIEGAAQSAPEPAAAEAGLVGEAEGRRDFTEAARHQRIRLNMIPSPAVSDWEKLAALQEQALDYSSADAAREEIVRLFPRDSDALLACARYFAKWGRTDRATEIVRAVRAFDPANVQAAAALGRLLQGVRPAPPATAKESANAADSVLAKTPDGIPSYDLLLPPLPAPETGRVQAYLATFATAGDGVGGTVALFDEHAGGDSEREWRLEAIRCLAAQLDAPARQRWIVRWQDAPSASEKLWALYYSGARNEAFVFLTDLAARAPANANRRFALIWCALRMGSWKELGDWLWRPERTQEDHETFEAALGEWCRMGEEGQIASDLPAASRQGGKDSLDLLFAKAEPAQLWPCSRVFANHRRFPLAIALGRRAFDRLPPPRATEALALAQTLLANSEPSEARKVLKIAAAEPADSLDAPSYGALRTLFLLTPESERATWIEQTLAALKLESPASGTAGQPPSPVHTALSTALLHALSGNDEATRAALDRLIALRFVPLNESPSVERAWTFILAAGMQFQAWKLDSAAAHLWQRALSDEASIQLQGERAMALTAEIRLRLDALELAAAAPGQAAERIANLAVSLPVADLIQLAGYLQERGFLAAAVRVLAEAQKSDAKAPLPRLLAACAAIADKASAESAIERWLDGAPDDAASAQVALEYLNASDSGRSAEFANKIAAQGHDDPRVLDPLSRLQRKLEQRDAAEQTLRKLIAAQSGNIEWRVAMADVLAADAKPKAALDILKDAPRRMPELDAKTAECLAGSGDLVKARAATVEVLAGRSLLPTGSGGEGANPSAFQRIAAAFAAHGGKADGLALLAAAADTASEARQPRAAFILQRELLLLLGPSSDAKPEDAMPGVPASPSLLRARWLSRWKSLAAGRPDFLAAYYELTADSRWLPPDRRKAELVADWNDGRGSSLAGAWLVADLLEARQLQAAEAVLATLLFRRDLSEPLLTWLDDRCKRADRPDLALRITETLLKRAPMEPEFVIRHARTLHALGRNAETATALRHAASCSVFTPEAAGRFGLAAADCAIPAVARKLLETAIRTDPAAQQTAVYLAYVRLLLDARDFHAAKPILRQAYRNPAARDPQPIVEYLRRSGRTPATELRDLELPADVSAEVIRLVR